MTKVLDQETGNGWAVYHGDCVEVIQGIPDNSIGFSVFSPPFASLYTYTNSERDMGNCRHDDQFDQHFAFLVEQLFRVTMPGRNCSFHCMNLPTSKRHHGVIGLRDFRGDLIRAFIDDEAAEMHAAIQRLKKRQTEAMAVKDMQRYENLQVAIFRIEQELKNHPGKTGWIFHSEVCIWKDPVTAMQRTKALGLLHKQVVKDSCMSRQGVPDYLVTMRKPGVNPERVEGQFDKFCGDMSHEDFETELIRRQQATALPFDTFLSVNIWQRYASPVWMDIDPGDTLQRTSAREAKDERHICPLQLQVIERALTLWSNPGDTVLSPFAGIGSEGFKSIKMGRKFIGIELKPSYYRQACLNLHAAEDHQAELMPLSSMTEPQPA